MSRQRGEGPGSFSPEGDPVELYANLAAGRIPDVVDNAVPTGAAILELGAGAGRLTHQLLDRGHTVVAVDHSAEMLARIQGARTVRAEIPELDLRQRFDAVVLGSCLVNLPDAEMRYEMLATCRRHVSDDGCVVVERARPEWFTGIGETRKWGAVTGSLVRVEHLVPGLLRATMEYHLGEQRWTHLQIVQLLEDEEIDGYLDAVNLRRKSWLTDDKAWLTASPIS